ncbi:MAG TPA: 30S ribosomal protein S6 [Candidatus Pacearchaeota archaeon]|nr:30S ribosomal protein S6 [Candidatus Pacearchaeota archaeon]
MKLYEINCLIKPEMESEMPAISAKIQDILVNAQATIEYYPPFSKTRLSTPVDKYKEAFFVMGIFSADPEKIENIKKDIIALNGILKIFIMVTSKDALEQIFRKPEENKEEKPQEEKTEEIKTEDNGQQPAADTATEEKISSKKKKVELSDIDKKLEEMLNE